jgi:LysM repeat protein
MRSASAVPSPPPHAGACGYPLVVWPLLAVLALSLSGCDWLSRPAGDPRREGNFQDGLRWADQGRWDNARESYYRALETNPQNLHAHLSLGDLYRARLTNQVLALYHYHRYLELGRAQNNGEFRDQSAADGIRNAEVELARGYAERMFRDQQQYELDNLRRTNAVLLQRIDVLTHHIGLLSRQVASQTNPPVAPPTDRPRTPLPETPAQPISTPQGNRGTPIPPAQPTQPAPARTHRVAAGETLSVIARQYRIGVPALQAANPSVDARRLRPGQMLVIPTR